MGLKVFDLGLIDYKESYSFQKEIFEAVKNRFFLSALILCQHHPVITLGRNAGRKNILLNAPELSVRGIQIYETERGGDVTYHGPGQLTVYPILDLHYHKKDINLYLRNLEQVVIDLLWDFGIKGERLSGLTGIWIEEKTGIKKVASIGIAIKNWITFHGLSINIKKDDLKNFTLIRPCGMDIQMTSLESLLGRDIDIGHIKHKLANIFKEEQNDQSCLAGIR